MAGRRLLYLVSPLQVAALLAANAAPAGGSWFQLARLSPYIFLVTFWLVSIFLGIRFSDLAARVLPPKQAQAAKAWGILVAFGPSSDDELLEFTKLKATTRPVLVAYVVSAVLAVGVFFGAF